MSSIYYVNHFEKFPNCMYWVPGVSPTPNFVILKIWRFFKIEKLVEFKIGKKIKKICFKKPLKNH
jgi:hypothetical protein